MRRLSGNLEPDLIDGRTQVRREERAIRILQECLRYRRGVDQKGKL